MESEKDKAITQNPYHLSGTKTQLFSKGHLVVIGGSLKSLVISSCSVTTRAEVEHTMEDYLEIHDQLIDDQQFVVACDRRFGRIKCVDQTTRPVHA